MVVSEFPLVQPHRYDAQIPPVVDLSGALMFVSGLGAMTTVRQAIRHAKPRQTPPSRGPIQE